MNQRSSFAVTTLLIVMIAALGKLGLGYIPKLFRTYHRVVSVCGHGSSISDIERTVYSFLREKCAIDGGSHLVSIKALKTFC